MRIIATLLAALFMVSCSDPTPEDMIEILMGDGELGKLDNAGQIISELLQEGFPNTNCGNEDDPTENCNGQISVYQLHVQPVVGSQSGRVYLQCVIHDKSDYRALLSTCLERVREQVSK